MIVYYLLIISSNFWIATFYELLCMGQINCEHYVKQLFVLF